jgi:hypothetical protein
LGTLLFDNSPRHATSATKQIDFLGFFWRFDSEGQIYFLALLLIARLIIFTCHALIPKYHRRGDAIVHGAITIIVAGVCFSTSHLAWESCGVSFAPGTHDFFLCKEHGIFKYRDFEVDWREVIKTSPYIPIYLASFYFGPFCMEILYPLKCTSWRAGLVCLLTFCVYVIAVYVLPANGVQSITALEPHDMLPISLTVLPLAITIFIFFLNLPSWIDFQLPGLTLLVIFLFQTQIIFYLWLYGLSFHGLQLLPSLPDVTWAAGELPHWIFWGVPAANSILQMMGGLLQVFSALVITLGFMLTMSWVVRTSRAYCTSCLSSCGILA